MLPPSLESFAPMAEELAGVRGVCAVVLAGSYARGRAVAGSDLDLALLYRAEDPIDLDALRGLAARHDPTAEVTDFHAWGPWMNGGAWLEIDGQRVDWIFREIGHIEAVARDAQAGRYEHHWGQTPPYGFFGPTYLGEAACSVPLVDPDREVARLAALAREYPDALRAAVVRDQLWGAEFAVDAFARKHAARGDVFGTAGCLTRAAKQLTLVWFAWNRRHIVNDKTAMAELDELAEVPVACRRRTEAMLAHPGDDAVALGASVEACAGLVADTVALCGALYERPFKRPG